ncbi:MAG: ChbG/HpnK family deacetylase [Clostridia bacterium]|nr:ChbG/HpnK family deacetylase [Clostridia bacterium]
MAKYLIVNADDCGMCHSANKAVFELFEGGFIKSSTIMIRVPLQKKRWNMRHSIPNLHSVCTRR